MIALSIIFIIVVAFFMLCLVGALGNINKSLQLIMKREEEIIKVLKNSKK